MELVSVYQRMQKARRWDNSKVNYLPGAYGCALKFIYGDKYTKVDTRANKKRLHLRNKCDVVVYETELV